MFVPWGNVVSIDSNPTGGCCTGSSIGIRETFVQMGSGGNIHRDRWYVSGGDNDNIANYLRKCQEAHRQKIASSNTIVTVLPPPMYIDQNQQQQMGIQMQPLPQKFPPEAYNNAVWQEQQQQQQQQQGGAAVMVDEFGNPIKN